MKKLTIILGIILCLILFGCDNKRDLHDEHSDATVHQKAEDHSNHEHDIDEQDHESHSHVSESIESHEDETEEGENHDQEILQTGKNWEELVNLKTFVASEMPIELILEVPGKIIPNENQIAEVSPFIEASVNKILVNIGDRVEAGEDLACLICPEIGILRADYYKAKVELEIEKENFDRQSKLFRENIVSRKSYQQTELNYKVAQVNYEYARKKLMAMGIKENEIDHPSSEHSDAVGATIHLHAPISGIISYRNLRAGEKVDNSDKLFEIINLTSLWLEADIFEKDLTKISLGQKVKATVSAYDSIQFQGKIFYIGNTLNPETKTIKIMAEIGNKEEKLKPGMFAKTRIVIGKKSNSLLVPKEAVLTDEALKVIFVKEGEGFHRHIVTTGIESDQYIEILSGLSIGAKVAIQGNYQLKSMYKMSSVDPHAGHNH